MRKSKLKPGLSYLSALLLAVAFFASPLAANAQTQRCELDWDCSGFVTFHDVYKHQSGGLAQVKSTGFYADVYYYTVYHNTYPEYVDGGYFHQYMQCGSPGNMDWNGDGVIDMTDAYEGNPSSLRLDNFYTQWYVWEYFHRSYDYFYPDSDCQADQPGSCAGKCGEFGGGANLYPCWCTEDCADTWDGCCDDYEEYCEVNACDPPECDDDGICDEDDNCPCTPNPGQENTYGDERGDACEPIECDPGYEPRGTECVDIDECARGLDNCGPNETCTNTAGSFTCEEQGCFYDGQHYEVGDKFGLCDECECIANGYPACVDVDCCAVSNFECDPGYDCIAHPGSFECRDIDECALGIDNCDPNATCDNTGGSFTCTCNPGFTGDGVHCVDQNPCDDVNCDPNATCENVANGTDCVCNPGYTGDGYTCVDINECAMGTDNCDPNATCTNTDGGFACTCNPGCAGDGTACVDIDDCAMGNDNCDANATCTNVPCAFTCACNPGFSGDGVTCFDDDECALGTDNCDANATCTNEPGSFSCACDEGYSGDGVSCIDIDECSIGTDNCDANANCTNTPGSYACYCNTGFSGDGVTCVDDNECDMGTHDCTAGYRCNNTPGAWTCTDINECMENTHDCDLMYYTCENTVGSFNCTCIDVDSDGLCDFEDPCPNDPYNTCCQSAADCGFDEYCEIAVETCGLEGQCVLLPLACDEFTAPVCGCDGRTYWSECEADFADAAVALLDVCSSPLPCTENNECAADEFCYVDGYCMVLPENCPMGPEEYCGADGNNYANPCMAAAAGTTLIACDDPFPCVRHSECASDEYCAGSGCGTDLTCDPLLSEGICTPKRDIAECAGAPISPTCGCDYNFYLNECELEAAGVRYQGAGLCSPPSCQTDADCPCGLICIGDMAKQCLPG